MKEGKKINSLWITVLLSLVIVVFTAGMLRITAHAAGPFNATYEDVPFYFCKGNFSFSCGSNDYGYRSLSFDFSDPDSTYTLLYKSGSSYSYAIYSTNPDCVMTRTEYRDEYEPDVVSSTFSYSGYTMSSLEYVPNSSFVAYGDYGLSAKEYRNMFKEFVDAGYADDYKDLPDLKEDFSLKGFTYDDTEFGIACYWNGLSGADGFELDNVMVEVVPQLFITIPQGESLIDFDYPDTFYVPYRDTCFYKDYLDIIGDCPYVDSCELVLLVAPVYYPDFGTPIKGSSIKIIFDKLGNVVNVDVPSSGLDSSYYDFTLNNFRGVYDSSAGLDANNHKLTFTWNGSTIDNIIDYVVSDVKVEIYAHSLDDNNEWGWLEYELPYNINLTSNFLSFTVGELYDYCVERGFNIRDVNTSMMDGVRIRFTPCYKTHSEFFYGRLIYVTLENNGRIVSITQSLGDAYSEDNSGFEQVESTIPKYDFVGNLVDDVFTQGEEDFDITSIFYNFYNMIRSVHSSLGSFPALFASVFSFLPDYYVSMLVISLSVVVILRILGR